MRDDEEEGGGKRGEKRRGETKVEEGRGSRRREEGRGERSDSDVQRTLGDIHEYAFRVNVGATIDDYISALRESAFDDVVLCAK